MEDILDLYELAYDPNRPVVCFDERPCQLLADVLAPIAMKPGSAKKLDEHYQRNGTCTVLMACEPLKGSRVVETKQRRTKQEYALFLKYLSDVHYPDAEKILFVQDNLNTYGGGALYETFDAETARRLTRHYEFHYTPKKASWLNMAEIELSALSKQCLDRRIGEMGELAKEAEVWASKRNQQRAKIEWRFTTNNAREKLERHYTNVKN